MPRPKGSTAETPPAILAARRRLGTSIRSAREELTLSREQLAERAGVEADLLKKIEAGASNSTFLTFQRIAAGLGMTLALAPASTAPRGGKPK